MISTHVLDAARGRPGAGVPVRLETKDGDGWQTVAEARTDDDGRIRPIGPRDPQAGLYRLVFDTADYLGPDAFFPEIAVCFRLTDADAHHHVPVLLSPFAYSTYRGS